MIIAEIGGNEFCKAIGIESSISSCPSNKGILRSITNIRDKAVIYNMLRIDYTDDMPDITVLLLDEFLRFGESEHEDNINMIKIRELGIDLLIVRQCYMCDMTQSYPLMSLAKHNIIVKPGSKSYYDIEDRPDITQSEMRRSRAINCNTDGLIQYNGNYQITPGVFNMETLIKKVRSVIIISLYESSTCARETTIESLLKNIVKNGASPRYSNTTLGIKLRYI